MVDVNVVESEEAPVMEQCPKDVSPEVENALSFGYTEWNGMFPNIFQIYPVINRLHRPEPILTPEAQRVNNGMIAFYKDLFKEVPDNLRVFTYLGMAGGEELRWIRFQTDTESYTFGTREVDFSRWIDAALEMKDIGWVTAGNNNQALIDRGMHLNVSKLPIELPLTGYQTQFGKHEMDDLFDGDFKVLEAAQTRLKTFMTAKLREATDKTNVLVNAKNKKDHDLYLVFKAVTGFGHLDVSLEKVYPELPESGGVDLGSNPTTLDDFDDKKVAVAVKQIYNVGKQINKEIDRTRKLINQHPFVQKEFDQWLKTTLFAAGHFTKLVYGFLAEHNEALVNKAANEVIRALTYKGGNIGLDLNSWITWEYEVGQIPTRCKDPEVDFINILYKKYTDSFVTALYAYLINISNPLIRPYDYRTAADASDGVALGTIRMAK